MKTTDKSSRAAKIASCLIVLLVLAGMAFVPAVADVAKEGGILATLFLAFLGAIIAVQIIPGLMLFAMMAKGVISLIRKTPPELESKEPK
jgi:hypothetical protein